MKLYHLLGSLFILLILLLLVSCNSEPSSQLIASEKTLPDHFHEMAFTRETTPIFQYLITKVTNQDEFEQTWKNYRFKDDMPKVDFSHKEVFFIGVQESGSCPYELDVEIDSQMMTLTLSESDGACTSDATPRTFVIETEQELTKSMDEVKIIQSDVKTTVPVKESVMPFGE